MNKVLLAGANGFIGSFLYNKLNSSHSTFGLDYSHKSKIKDYYSVDLTKSFEVQNFVNTSTKFDALIFLVGLAHKKGGKKEIDEFKRINKQTLVNLLSYLQEKNKLPSKIIFASTISVYGEKINQDFYNEDSDKMPFTPYAVTKLEAEEFLLKHYSDKSWILRFAPVYSQGFKLNIHRRTKTGGWFFKIGNGSKKLSLCNLLNIGTAVRGILEDKVPASVYNISDKNEYTYNDLLNYVKAKWIVPIPYFMVQGLYYIGKIINNIFLKENATKLISDNIFPSDKIRKYISLTASLNDRNSNMNKNDQAF